MTIQRLGEDLTDTDRQLLAAWAANDQVAAARLEAELDAADAARAARVGATTMLQAALYYAEQGLKVFPLRPGTKIPFPGSRGFHDASTQPEVVTAWWTDTPDANIGIATGSAVDVVDIDGLPGQIARARNGSLFDSLTVLGTVSTPRPGGAHLYVPAAGVGNKAGLLDHVDYRGAGGYVVAPPSVITDGANPGRYTWTSPLQLTPLALGGAA